MEQAMRAVVDAFKESISSGNAARFPYFADSRYVPQALDIKNFCKIPVMKGEKTIVAIDGGNLEIKRAPNFSVHLVRVAASAYRGNKKIRLPVDEVITFYTLATSSVDEKGNVIYKTRIFPFVEKHASFLPRERDLVFDSFDPTIVSGKRRADISRMGAIVRCFSEWVLASRVAEVLGKGDIIVKDGSLQTGTTNESKYSKKAYDSALKSDVVFCGVSKTTSLLTDVGTSLAGELMKMADGAGLEGSWAYYPVVEIEHLDHCAEMYFTKLADVSEHAFRFEILNEQKEMAESTISAISGNSRDISFPGYPYALVDADRRARVRENEVMPHRIMFVSLVSKGGNAKEMARHISSSDAHGILDRMIR